MAKRKAAVSYIQEAHSKFLQQNECASSLIYDKNSKIQTTSYIKPVNDNQRKFVKSLKQNDLTVAIGPAGSGKSLLALFTGVALINNPEYEIERLVYIRTAVDVRGEKDIIGILPGDQNEKLSQLTYPLYDNGITFMTKETIDYQFKNGTFEVMPLSLARGRSLSNSFVILDEGSNITSEGMKTLLTRCGMNSIVVVIGDPDQCDINPLHNGLTDLYARIYNKLEDNDESKEQHNVNVGLIKFTKHDIVRSELTKFVIDLYS